MRAVAITAPGGPEVLDVIDRDVRPAGAGEVRIAVRAAAVNPTDIGLRARGAEGLQPPWIPGMDAAGVVESAGEGVDRLPGGGKGMAAGAPRRPEGGAPAGLSVGPGAPVVPGPARATVAGAWTRRASSSRPARASTGSRPETRSWPRCRRGGRRAAPRPS